MTRISDPHFAARVSDSFDRQQAMKLIGASLARVEHGLTEIRLPYRPEITQQHEFIHGGIVFVVRRQHPLR